MKQLLATLALISAKPATVHIVPHSHDDVGWLKTLDEYFDGSRKDIQYTDVKQELDTIIDALSEDSRRKFSEVEMKFFFMWWETITDEKKAETRRLVQNGQLEIINAGWSMHDEACPIYEDMINNMAYGQDFALKEFGVKPRIGWQIDPFGHSNANARLFHDMGFDAMFFGRMDAEELGERIHNKEMEWVQRPASKSLGNEVGILFHVMNNIYSSPGPYCFDITCSDSPFEDNTELETFNGHKEAELLDEIFTDLQLNFGEADSDIFQVFGMDFRYIDAFKNYKNLDRMIEYMNFAYPEKWHLQYATPSDYIDAIAALNRTWPTKTDDLFPYQSSPSCYWTGYFTSRANSKAQVRQGSSNLHAANQLYTNLLLD
jgi:hypothetical protein